MSPRTLAEAFAAIKYPRGWLGVIDHGTCGEGCDEHPPGETLELVGMRRGKGWAGGGYVSALRVRDGEPYRISFATLHELEPLTDNARAFLACAKTLMETL